MKIKSNDSGMNGGWQTNCLGPGTFSRRPPFMSVLVKMRNVS
jgi:hypothetical protein